jgi:hypothetical protein
MKKMGRLWRRSEHTMRAQVHLTLDQVALQTVRRPSGSTFLKVNEENDRVPKNK